MTERYVLIDLEIPRGSDIFHVGDLIEEEKNPDIAVELIDDVIVVWTSLSITEVQELVWKHNGGLLCEPREITEDEYDALC